MKWALLRAWAWVRLFVAGILSVPAMLIGKPAGWVSDGCRAWVEFCVVYIARLPVPKLRSLQTGPAAKSKSWNDRFPRKRDRR
jgi:hypothetical protein